MSDEVQEVKNAARLGPISHGLALNGEDLEAPVEKNVLQTPTSMLFREETTFQEWSRKGAQMSLVVNTFSKHLKWWLGDWIIYGQTKWPDMYSQALEKYMYEYGTLRNAVWVCRHVAPNMRRDKLTFEHHYQVAALSAKDQAEWLRLAEINGWTVAEMKRAIKGEKAEKPLELYVNGENTTKKKQFKYKDFEDYSVSLGRPTTEVEQQAFYAAREME